MAYVPSIPLIPSDGLAKLVAKGWMGHALVQWPRGEEHRPVMRGLLRATALDGAGKAHAYLHVVPISLPAAQDLTRIAEVRTHDWGRRPQDATLYDDGDGRVFAAVRPVDGPAPRREVAIVELAHLAARMLGPDEDALARPWAEPFGAAVKAGIPVTTLHKADVDGLPSIEVLRNRGVTVASTDAHPHAAAYALDIAGQYAWTGEGIAFRARLPRWLLMVTTTNRVRLVCCAGYQPMEHIAAVAFPLDQGERARALAQRVADLTDGGRMKVEGAAEVVAPLPEELDGAFETARGMVNKLRHLLRSIGPALPEGARAMAEAYVEATRQQKTISTPADAQGWWERWHALSAVLPADLPQVPDMRKFQVVRCVLDGAGYGTPLPRPVAVPVPPPEAKPPARLALDAIEFTALAQAKAVATPGPVAELLRAVSAATSDMAHFLSRGDALYGAVWQEALDAGVALRSGSTPEGLSRLSKAISVLRQCDPLAFPDVPSAARWAMELRPRLRILSETASRLSEDQAGQAFPEAAEPRVPPPVETPLPPADPERREGTDAPARRRPPRRAPGIRLSPPVPPIPATGEARRAPPARPLPPEAEPSHDPITSDEPQAVPDPVAVEPPQVLPAIPDAAYPEPDLTEVPVSEPTAEVSPDAPEPDRATPEPDVAQADGVEPTEDSEEGEAPSAPELPAGDGRPKPTRNGLRVLAAMAGSPPMRKTDIADKVGIGRGAANRTVERLVQDGWMRQSGVNRFELA